MTALECRLRMIGATLAHYTIEDCLGQGGSGVVYRGRDLRLERKVAVKVLSDALRDDEHAWARLLREARLASQLNHPHITATYDLGEEDGRAYIVMEYVEGLPLADLIPEGGMPLAQAERYFAQISDALAYAHEQGVVHGDLKGSNIVTTPDGQIKLLDFGLARRVPRSGMSEITSSSLPLADASLTSGTLPYLAPEVLRGGTPTRQSDIWALGVLLYQMVTGELPFRGETAFDLCVEIMVGTPSRLGDLPARLQGALRGALEKDVEARFPRIHEFRAALEANSGEAVPASTPAGEVVAPIAAAEPANAKPSPLHRKWWPAGVAAILGILLLGGVYVRRYWVPRQPAQPIAASDVVKAPAAENPAAKVWVNTDSGTYHCAGTRWYGKTQVGQYMTQKQAREKGYHPASNRACR